MTKDLQGSSHHLKVVGGAYGKRLAVVVYSGSVVKTKTQAFYNEPISVAELGRCPH